MSIGIANIASSVGRPAGLDTALSAKDQPAVAVAAVPGQPEPTGGAVKTERADAVQPTPASAKAVKVDLVTDDTVSGELPEYPVFGPDKFARVAAEKSQAAADENAAKVAAAQERAATVPDEPVADKVATDQEPQAVQVTRNEAAAPEDDAPVEVAEVSSAGVPEQPAEASEARLTD